MKKIHKAVLKSSFIMLILPAAAGSGVARAQECIAQGKSVTARAEGITEGVGTVELWCAEPTGLSFGSPAELEVAVELNTRITSVIDDDRVVAGLSYTALSGTGVTDTDFAGAKLSEDGTTITWEITSSGVNLGTSGATGFQVTIGGIKANASTVGDGEDVTAVVRVGGAAVHRSSLKLADVSTGLVVKADAAEILQCADTYDAMAVIKIQEGFTNAITDADSLVVTFTGIPEGVKVLVPDIVMLATDDPDTTADEAAASFSLDLIDEGRTSGVGKIEDNMGEVELSESGAGEVVYNLADTASTVGDEGVTLPVTFVRESEDDLPAIGRGRVTVNFHPVNSVGGDTFKVGGAPLPRFVESGKSAAIIAVDACTTTLLFPFVLNQTGFDTGITISNTSSKSGFCTINYHGAGGPDPHESSLIAGGGQLVFTLSSTLGDAAGFQGYLVADCDFRKAYGFALILNGFGGAPTTLAQGYLAVRNPWNK